MKRTLVFGDIHGGLQALKQLIGRVEISKEDKLIFLGDYVDGWSESAQVIQYLIELEQTYNCVFIRGNHDVWCYDWLLGSTNNHYQAMNKVWYDHGGKASILSYKNTTTEQKLEHLSFFERMKDFYIDEENRLFIHAGFSSMRGPVVEVYATNYSWDRTLWELALALDNRMSRDSILYPKRLLLYHEIYIGHTPTINYNVDVPMNGGNVWNIDTGAAFLGKLSCIDCVSKRFWQSDQVQSLYPNEKGRN